MTAQLPLPEIGPDAPPPLTRRSSLRSATAAFERYMRRKGFSEHTVKAFLYDLHILAQFTGPGVAVGDISTHDLEQFVHWLTHERGVECTSKSRARRVTTLKVFFGWLAETEVLHANPADPIVHQPVSTSMPRVLSDAEIRRVLAATEALRAAAKPDARPHLLVTLLLHTGIKKGECMHIALEHLDLYDPAGPSLWIRYANPRRRHKERRLSLPPHWPEVLEEYREQYDIRDMLFPCTARNLEYVLRHVADQAELSAGLSFEMLRWTCAVRDYRAGMEPDALRQKLGLSKISWREVKIKLEQLTARLPVNG